MTIQSRKMRRRIPSIMPAGQSARGKSVSGLWAENVCGQNSGQQENSASCEIQRDVYILPYIS